MSKQWISNASPLILLNKIDHLYLLTELSGALIIPKCVIDELSFHQKEQLPFEAFFSSAKVRTFKENVHIHQEIAGWDLGKGESEVISYGIDHHGCEVILDDLQARKCAQTFNIPVRGTVGIILLAKKKNLIKEATPLIRSLINSGLRFDRQWIIKALELIDEKFD